MRRTPEVTCPWGHPLRQDGSHIVQADLELHVWFLESRAGVQKPCVNSQLCIHAGAPWHRADSKLHQEPPRA